MTAARSVFSVLIPHLLAILVAAAGCVAVAFWAKDKIETDALQSVGLVLSHNGHDWADVTVDGLSVSLTGTAPDEATRFAALSTTGTVVDASRIIDNMSVVDAALVSAPDFSIELLKNEDGISLIGLVPLASDPTAILEDVTRRADGANVSNLLESADFPVPSGWESALAYGLETLGELPRSKVSIAPGSVAITAVAEDADDKTKLENRLRQRAPGGVGLALNITAPRPVVAPFTLRFVMDDEGPRFDACTADSDAARTAIVTAAQTAGTSGTIECVLGLGTPSTQWSDAATAGIKALTQIERGSFTLSNADATLRAEQGVSKTVFDQAAGQLEAALPDVFSLSAILPAPEEETNAQSAPPEFTAIRSPEGQVQLRGRLADAPTRAAVQSFAAAEFGAKHVYPSLRLDNTMPAGWTKRVLAALEALGQLHNGIAEVTEDQIVIKGRSGNQDAQSEITRILSSQLGNADFKLDVSYSETLDKLASLPTPDECIQLISDAGNKRKITFAPSSTDFENDAVETIDTIAEILRDCQTVRIEIGGHTDSQGRETMNEQLSQARADAVLNAIMARRVLVSNLTAKGYGESRPIADNDTENGREANRRIEFTLVQDPEPEDTDAVEPDAETEDAPQEESTE